MPKTAALVLAAGKGTRMHSDNPKVLQTLLGEYMLTYVLAALRPHFGEDIWIVAGHQARMLESAFPRGRFVFQAEQLGTGHALRQALPALAEAGCRHILVVNGDTPLLDAQVTQTFLEKAGEADLAFAVLELADPASYGRVMRESGKVRAVVEAKDCDPLTLKLNHEVNAGMYLLSLHLAETLSPRINRANKSGEYYITDLVALAVAGGYEARAVECGREESLLGVNSPPELSRMEEILRERVAERLLQSGVLLHAPDQVRVSPFARIEPGAELTGPCEILGRSEVKSGARVASHCVVRDSVIDEGAELRHFSHLEGVRVGKGALVGPFARLRPGASLEANSRVGNFVELKNVRLGEGAKANHLTYLGDADVGAGANIGAGTITCNYDGQHKYRTSIGEKAFVGSNTALVAPVVVGANTLVGAGSVITGDVPEGEMAIARSRQKNLSRKKISSEY
ncbi:MAG: bifunctional UDP-N-acetylglucosamine diphosphorylase/glucosamine-1-phosphate N-acetyltransferase GlmU [Desulfovibrio sp.]|jgi:bifunctional UDP-N-acetylglucosamine pyrophosphorylase/glucosamine-1-phosphate N-acetyltransferase|nr:bifunctional UDP-N-acetylglucosamine diphosphorylase/glucosamine-1-phosphate N-acetyltransferase GlmU [Desulfovibrio sp.]